MGLWDGGRPAQTRRRRIELTLAGHCCHRRAGLGPVELAGRRIPPLVTQIAGGENGGVVMNEFPPSISGAFAAAVPHRVWKRFEPGEGPERLAAVINALRAGDNRFSMEGGSWANDI